MRRAVFPLCASAWHVWALFGLCTATALADSPGSVAVIGSGVAGAASAFFLRQRLPDARITVFERAARVGGRTRTIPFGTTGVSVDAGATSISTLNQYLTQFVAELGLRPKPDTSGTDSMLGIWDGSRLVFTAHEDWRLPVAAALRYGFSPVRMVGAVRSAVGKLAEVYQKQAAGVSWTSPRRMFEQLGLYNLTQTDAYSYLDGLGVSTKFTKEFIDGASRDNYNQPGTVNAFVDLVSLAGAGIDGHVFELANGTSSLPEGLLGRANLTALRMSTTVTKISRGNTAGFRLQSSNENGERHTEAFDAVVIATPLEFTSIELPSGVAVPSRRPYQQTYATFVAGKLSSALFGRSDFDTVLTVENSSIPFSCIGQHDRLADGTYVYKVFSRTPLEDVFLDTLFEQRGHTQRVAWNASGAYPKLTPSREWPEFELLPGLAYVNAMESAVSCMETEIIAAKNAALLLS